MGQSVDVRPQLVALTLWYVFEVGVATHVQELRAEVVIRRRVDDAERPTRLLGGAGGPVDKVRVDRVVAAPAAQALAEVLADRQRLVGCPGLPSRRVRTNRAIRSFARCCDTDGAGLPMWVARSLTDISRSTSAHNTWTRVASANVRNTSTTRPI